MRYASGASAAEDEADRFAAQPSCETSKIVGEDRRAVTTGATSPVLADLPLNPLFQVAQSDYWRRSLSMGDS